MIKKTFFSKIKKDLNLYQKERGVIINESRKILQGSKKTIFALHREDKRQAQKNLKEAEQVLKKLNQIYDKDNRLRFEGSYKAAVEEYVEAKAFSLVLTGKPLDKINIKSIGPEEYINGLADLTGELVRQAVLQVTKGNFKIIEKYKKITEEVAEFLLTLYLTGVSRQKFDDAKRNLKRLEQILYDLKIKKGA